MMKKDNPALRIAFVCLALGIPSLIWAVPAPSSNKEGSNLPKPPAVNPRGQQGNIWGNLKSENPRKISPEVILWGQEKKRILPHSIGNGKVLASPITVSGPKRRRQ